MSETSPETRLCAVTLAQCSLCLVFSLGSGEDGDHIDENDDYEWDGDGEDDGEDDEDDGGENNGEDDGKEDDDGGGEEDGDGEDGENLKC